MYEISRRSVNTNKYEELYTIWSNSYLALQGDGTIRIFELSYNLRCTDKKIDCIDYSIETPTKSPASDLFGFISKGVSGIDLVQMTMDTALWSYNKHLLQKASDILTFEWSPRGMMWNNGFILAILNNVGHIEFYKKCKKTWTVVQNLSALVIKQLNSTLVRESNDIDTIKVCAYTLVTSAICWAPFINKDNSTYFVTVQKNGIIIFWLIKEEDKNIKVTYIDQINTDFRDIISIKWIPRASNFVMLCSNSEGQIFLLECLLNEKVTLQSSHMLWRHKDRMPVKHCAYVILEDKIMYVCNKHRHLLAQLVTNDNKVLAQHVKNVNDYKITDICKHNNFFYISTVNGCMFKMNYEVTERNLDIQYELINLKDFNQSYELHSCSFSENGAILATTVIDRKIMNRKSQMKLEIIYYTPSDTDFPEFLILLNNPTKKLTNFWDCMEVLRFKMMKWRRLPEYDYKALLLEGETDIYKLKVYLIVLIICNVLEENFKIDKGNLPERSIQIIREKIAIAHSKTLLISLYNKSYQNHIPLSDFEEECFVGCKNYLEVTNKKYKSDLGISNIISLVDKEYNYTCQCCDKIINGFSCEDGHLNAFCSLTYTPIENDDYLVCKSCGVTARYELINDRPMCKFCDLYLQGDL
ncbi:unnamed protein product [Diatraea saccharalis]|uniref:Transcription factor IIIC 90kDa subunit N-terminal domain-containing protein n=1 Tax=Diatraea saccharalis TaxID=40085 RepID=A0A9N9WHY9_9NEOP|nr:unnamed protein product [Diatraea saccharalis]